MTNRQWIRSLSFLNTCSGLYVGDVARGRRFVVALRRHPWCQLPAAYGKWNSVYRRYADWCGLLHMQAETAAVWAGRAAVSDFNIQIPVLADRKGCPLCLHMTGGPQIRTTPASRPGLRRMLRRTCRGSCLSTDRANDVDVLRAWRTQQGIAAVIPARVRRTNSRPHDPERYQARHAMHGAWAGLHAGDLWLPVRTNTFIVAWISVLKGGLALAEFKFQRNLI